MNKCHNKVGGVNEQIRHARVLGIEVAHPNGWRSGSQKQLVYCEPTLLQPVIKSGCQRGGASNAPTYAVLLMMIVRLVTRNRIAW